MGTVEYTPFGQCQSMLPSICADEEDKYLDYRFSLGDIIWTLSTVKFTEDDEIAAETELLFDPSSVDIINFCGNWKIEGKLVFIDHVTNGKLLEIDFSCDNRHRSHLFESGILIGRKLSYILQFSKLVGLGVTPRPNYFQANEMTDVCLLLGEGEERVKLHLSKAVLAQFSEYFKAMFFGSFAEKNMKEVELKDVDVYDFVNLLDLLFGAYLFQYVEDEIHVVFALADRFAMPVATKRLQSYVIEHYEEENVITYLIWADKFNLNLLMSQAIADFTVDDVKSLQNMEERYDLQAATLLAIMKITTSEDKKEETGGDISDNWDDGDDTSLD